MFPDTPDDGRILTANRVHGDGVCTDKRINAYLSGQRFVRPPPRWPLPVGADAGVAAGGLSLDCARGRDGLPFAPRRGSGPSPTRGALRAARGAGEPLCQLVRERCSGARSRLCHQSSRRQQGHGGRVRAGQSYVRLRRSRASRWRGPRPEKRLDGKYAHLRAAVAGRSAVSGVVPSAARAEPIVALAVPFETPFGRRVFSGGTPIARTPLGPYLDNALPFKGAHAYLIDAEGIVIAAGGSDGLALPPQTRGRAGDITVAGEEYRFAAEPVPGTSWRLLTLAPSAQLLAPLSGPKQWIPWVVLLAFALASIAALGLLRRLIRQRAELAHLATHDPLTGALNRRTLERAYSRLAFEAERAGTAVGVLTIDLDHFKDVNDTFGHAAGDDVLRGVAEALLTTVRPSDVVARIGGDEFVVLLASVDRQQADMVAERVVQTLAKIIVPALGAVELRPTCSAGIALAGQHDTMGSALSRADSALYQAKVVGRNGWRPAAA